MLRRHFLSLMTSAAAWLGAPPASGAQTRTAVAVTVATGVTPPSIHNIFMHVAHERGFFRANGVTVDEFIQLRAGPLVMQAIAAGKVDVTAADPEGLLSAVSAGHAVRAVAAPGARLSYMVAVRKEIRTLADLRGQPFAISRPGAISHYLMFPLLDREGVPRDAVQWVGVGSTYDRLLALQADRVKGALLQIDFAMEAGTDPNLRLVTTVADVLPEYPVELLVLRKDLIDRQPEAALALTRAVIQACRYIVLNKAGTLDVMRQYTPGTNPSIVARAYDELLRLKGFGVDGGMTEANMRIAHDLALQNGQIASPVPLSQWADFRFQDRAVRQLGAFAGA
jgi:ABC-type nitrate/sulfonate/bicarbonate transport system substrate-binding protein